MKTYFYSDGDQQFGPFTFEELQAKKLQADFLVWTEGMAEWKKISEVEEFAFLFKTSVPPPLPPKEKSNDLQGFTPITNVNSKPQKSKSGGKKFVVTLIILAVLALIIIAISYFYSETDYFDNVVPSTTETTDKDDISKNTKKVVEYAEIGGVSELRSNSAVISGTMIHNDSELLDLQFEYSDGGAARTIRAERDGNVVKANLSNLYPNTTYQFCIIEYSNSGERRTRMNSFTTLPRPPQIITTVTKHDGRLFSFFNIGNISGDKRKLKEACNYQNTNVRSTALNIAGQTEGNFNLGQICDIFDYCYNNWVYVNDPKKEVYEYASNTLSNGLHGDCDDFAVLVCSMLIAIGGDARINFAYSDTGGHAYTEINVGRANMQDFADYVAKRYSDKWTGSIHYKTDSYGNNWLNLDWQARHPGGEYFKANKGTKFYILDDYCEDL